MHCSYIMAFFKLKILTAIWAFMRIIEPFLISLCSQSTFMILQPQSHSAIWWKQQMQNPESLMIESLVTSWGDVFIQYVISINYSKFSIAHCDVLLHHCLSSLTREGTTSWGQVLSWLMPPVYVMTQSHSLMRSLVVDHKVIKKWP